MLWLTISVMLFARHYVDLSVLVALPALGLLLVRCLAVGAPPPEPSQISVRLLELLVPEGVRVLRLLLVVALAVAVGAAVLTAVLLAISTSPTPSTGA